MNKPILPVPSLWHRLKDADHFFVMRYCVALILAWYLSSYLELDKPYWAMMTVSIVSLPSPGSSIIKLIARLIGTTLGVIIITPIVRLSQYDPWLMSCLIALWVSFCHYICCCYYGSVSYCFALSGYTASIIGFASTSSPSDNTLFFISQARFTEIVLGLFLVFIVSFIFPSNKDEKLLLQSEKQLEKSLVAILKDHVIKALPTEVIMKSVTSFILQMMNIKVLATQYIFSSSNTSDKGLQSISNIYHSFDVLGSLIMLKIMKSDLDTQEPDLSEKLNHHEKKIEQWIDQPTLEKPVPLPSDNIYLQNFYEEFDSTTEAVIKPKKAIINENNETLFFTRGYHDQKEALYNGFRTFLTIMCAVVFWLNGNWQYGYIGVIFLSVVCCYLSMIPMIRVAIFFAALGLIAGIITAFILKFGVLIGISEYMIAVLSFLVMILFLCYLQMVFSPIWALFSFVATQVIIFSINFQNPMDYGFASFLNISLMLLFSMLVIIGVLYVLPPSAEQKTIARMRKAIDKKFNQYLSQKINFIQFKIYLASVINEAKFVVDTDLKNTLIIGCFCEFLVAYLFNRYDYQLQDYPEITRALETRNYQKIQQYIDTVVSQDLDNEAKVFWWKLRCIINNIPH